MCKITNYVPKDGILCYHDKQKIVLEDVEFQTMLCNRVIKQKLKGLFSNL